MSFLIETLINLFFCNTHLIVNVLFHFMSSEIVSLLAPSSREWHHFETQSL